jgi:hypothetical protein
MPLLSLSLLFAAPALMPSPPACQPARLRLSTDAADGDFNGMSHSGVRLRIVNNGPTCLLPALPQVTLRDAHGRPLPAQRRAPPGMHPGPVMLPHPLAAGQSAMIDLRWVSGPVFPASRSLHAAQVSVLVGKGMLRAPLKAVLYGPAGQTVTFDQSTATTRG